MAQVTPARDDSFNLTMDDLEEKAPPSSINANLDAWAYAFTRWADADAAGATRAVDAMIRSNDGRGKQ
ncbi:MAG TPA: hypothetical protein VI299_20390 [Polyangiales bacterium]